MGSAERKIRPEIGRARVSGSFGHRSAGTSPWREIPSREPRGGARDGPTLRLHPKQSLLHSAARWNGCIAFLVGLEPNPELPGAEAHLRRTARFHPGPLGRRWKNGVTAAGVAKLADAPDLGSGSLQSRGSSPLPGIFSHKSAVHTRDPGYFVVEFRPAAFTPPAILCRWIHCLPTLCFAAPRSDSARA